MLAQPQLIHYLPILTTLLSVAFFITLIHRYRTKKRGAHLLWWAAGVLCYGLGTAFESTITLHGNTILLNKLWYIAGALLGGYPLAQGTVYLLLRRRIANWLTLATVPVILIGSICVMLSPVDTTALNAVRPSGSILAWQWVRLITPFVNIYAGLFLIGGAVLSAVRFGRHSATRHRAIGNTYIAIGALLPGIGGSLTKAIGLVESLYVGEFVGLILIWIGYAYCIRRRSAANDDALDLTAVRPVPVAASSSERRNAIRQKLHID